MFNAPFGIPPADGRIVFGDTETITIRPEHREMWEGALILRDPGKPDVEIEWQMRPNLVDADPISLRIGRYYRRNRALALSPGEGVIVTAPGWPELEPYAEGDATRVLPAWKIANQMAPLLDGATVIGEVPSFDDVALHKFLRDNGQALTSGHRLQCINNLIYGYLNGKADTLAILGREEEASRLYEAIPEPAGSPDELSVLVGVKPPADDLRHRALVDARWVRDRFDAITNGRYLALA